MESLTTTKERFGRTVRTASVMQWKVTDGQSKTPVNTVNMKLRHGRKTAIKRQLLYHYLSMEYSIKFGVFFLRGSYYFTSVLNFAIFFKIAKIAKLSENTVLLTHQASLFLPCPPLHAVSPDPHGPGLSRDRFLAEAISYFLLF